MNAESLRSWQSALRQLADTLAPAADIEIDSVDPEVSCARIVEAVQHQREAVCAGIESIGCNCRELHYAFWGELPDHEITKHEPACPVAIAALVASRY